MSDGKDAKTCPRSADELIDAMSLATKNLGDAMERLKKNSSALKTSKAGKVRKHARFRLRFCASAPDPR
jgi:hypothetical protein